MALTAYTRFRFNWGGLDFETDDEAPTYGASSTQSDLTTDKNGRRCVIKFSRPTSLEDAEMTHIDLINITSGVLDDTWTGTDFTNAETAIDAWWTTAKAWSSSGIVLDELRWYRVGPGATPPEPAVRVSDRNVAGTNGNGDMPHQCCSTVTLKTGLRRRWGRMYMPTISMDALGSSGDITSTRRDAIALAAHNLITALAASDFYAVVWSPTRGRFYNVEGIQVDNVWDIQRRRRKHQSITRKTYP